MNDRYVPGVSSSHDGVPFGGRAGGTDPPAEKHWLHVTDRLCVEHDRRPNRWWRFWQWALLGWRWEDGP